MNFFKVRFIEIDVLQETSNFFNFTIYLGWSYWQFKKYQDLTTAASPATTESFYTEDGELEVNKVRALSRSYAQAIAGIFNNHDLFLITLMFLRLGQPLSMVFDATTARFQLVFIINTDIHQPTIIYINEELNYPQGCDINVTPVNSLTWNSTERNYYEFTPGTLTKNDTEVTILITRKTFNIFQRFWNWIKIKVSFWRK